MAVTATLRRASLQTATGWSKPSNGFQIGRIAISLIRPGDPSPPQVREVDLPNPRYPDEQRELITGFLSRRLKRSWDLEPSGWHLAAISPS
jgi:hypothetical protein